MEEKIRKILEESLKNKFNVPNETIGNLVVEIIHLLNSPIKKGGSYVMTEAASIAADKKDTKNARPTVM